MPRARAWLLVPLYVVVAAIGIGWGGRNTYRSLRNRAPLAITCARYIAERPAADWVRLERCTAGHDRVGIETTSSNGVSTSDAEAVYIPLRASDAGPAHIVLRVERGPLLALGARFPSDAELEYAEQVLARPIEGLVEGPLDRSERTRAKVRRLGMNVADDFVIVAYHERPRPLWLALPILGVGLAALALLVRAWRRRRRPVAIPVAKIV